MNAFSIWLRSSKRFQTGQDRQLPAPDSAERCSIDDREATTKSGAGNCRSCPCWKPRLLDLSQIENAFIEVGGFFPAKLEVASRTHQRAYLFGGPFLNLDRDCIQWLEQLVQTSGADYHVKRSGNFLLLSALDLKLERTLTFVEKTLDQINALLKEAAWKSGHGPHVILLFADEDDYYQYVSYFWGEGVIRPAAVLLAGSTCIADAHGNGRTVAALWFTEPLA